jgi:Mrp family chromosome partitioning ATPase
VTRIFEALKKSQGRAAALPFPSPDPAPPRPPVAPRAPAHAPATPAGPALSPRVDVVPGAPLGDEIEREMSALRVGLESALEGRKCRAVVFLSSLHGEGVTTVARQFVTALSADGRGRALLVDLHPGRPAGASHPAAGPPSPARVPRSRLARRGAEAEAPSGRAAITLSVAALGEELPRAGGRGPAAVRAFLETAATQFDWVVVDAPPVLESPESVHLAPLADGVVLVVRSGHAKRPVVMRAADLLRKSGARLLGSVLNRRRHEIPDFIYRRI